MQARDLSHGAEAGVQELPVQFFCLSAFLSLSLCCILYHHSKNNNQANPSERSLMDTNRPWEAACPPARWAVQPSLCPFTESQGISIKTRQHSCFAPSPLKLRSRKDTAVISPSPWSAVTVTSAGLQIVLLFWRGRERKRYKRLIPHRPQISKGGVQLHSEHVEAFLGGCVGRGVGTGAPTLRPLSCCIWGKDTTECPLGSF